MPRINTRHADAFIAELKPFTSNGAISAELDAVNRYVVKSYSTAIAVLYPDTRRAILNAARYSHTTSRHQAEARAGVAALGYAVTELTDPEAFTQATGYRARLRGANL